ncbi:acyltransferase family protein [Streptococcus tangpeifui]|uniref:acyltransferase family protein n=1 Tax=Streptococcus tangpeifui TaxID=2709400 RepID=UPI0013EDBC97|nr:acyltransferase family protein [Streptococcus sp. ZJ373]
MKRIQWLDFGKGFTIFLVLIGHVFKGMQTSGAFEAYHNSFQFIIQCFYIFHIPVFFALSGYLFKPVKDLQAYPKYVLKKSLNLLIPYLLFCVTYFFFQKLGGGSVREGTSLVDLLAIYKRPIAVSWYLYVLWGVSLYVGLLSVFIKDQKKFLAVTAVTSILSYPLHSSIFLLQGTLLWSGIYCLGHFLSQVSLEKLAPHLTQKVLVILALIALYLFWWIQFDFKNGVSYLTPGPEGLVFVLSVFLAFLIYPRLPRNSFFNYFADKGKSSLIIYIFHSPVLSAIRIMLLRLGVQSMLLHVLIGIAGGWLISLFIAYLFNKVKFLNFFVAPTKYIRF